MGKKRRGERAKKDSGAWGSAAKETAADMDAGRAQPYGAAGAGEGQARAGEDLHAAIKAQRARLSKFWKVHGAEFRSWWLELPRQEKVCRAAPGARQWVALLCGARNKQLEQE